MAYVFRLHNQGTNALDGWGVSKQYSSNIINGIDDPAGANATKEITSIPSPFARMDLVKKAFAYVNRNGHDGDTIHHKMVSHALDIAQIFFNFDKYERTGLLKLIRWDVSEIRQLKNSGNPQHRLLGNTLDLYWTSDADQFNFNDCQGLYMLRYTGPGKPSQLTIIGSTSPASLFYTSANNHDFLSPYLILGNHPALSSNEKDFVSLEKRNDEEFIAWMFALSKGIPNFASRFPEVNKYIGDAYGKLNYDLQNRINAMTADTLSTDYDPLEVQSGVPVEILGTQLGKNRPVDIGAKSDFAINPSKKAGQPRLPLVLPCDQFTQPWAYTVAPWKQSTKVPLNPGEMDKRVLPDDGTLYPYLTMTDFLEDTLIMTESKPNSKDFFDGNLTDNTKEEHAFLLPIKRMYFDYFTTDDLKENLSITCDKAPGGSGLAVKVSLKIPVHKGNITFGRTYTTDNSGTNPKNGTIQTKDFTLVLFPKTQFPTGIAADYVVSVMTKEEPKPQVVCLTNNGNVLSPALGPSDRNEDANGKRIDSNSPIMPMYSFKDNFDIMELSINGKNGVAIPEWGGVAGGSAYEFAVDFGTTNTHIEYKTAGNTDSDPLDITPEAQQLGTFSEDATEGDCLIALQNNYIPPILGGEGQVHFPMRTMLSYKKATNWNTPTAPYLTGSMAFYYSQKIIPAVYNEQKSNLKWSTDPDNRAMVECYLGSLMHIIRNKVVMEGGDLAQTRIRWFYPTSMPTTAVSNISNTWQRLYTRYIGPNGATLLDAIPESIAPYQYYRASFGKGVDVLTVDIGGGTSDAYIVDSKGKPAFITSFRFAANSLFGEEFIAKYKDVFCDILLDNDLANINAKLKAVVEKGNYTDYISLLFELKNNSDITNKGEIKDKVDFIIKLKESEGAKTLVLIFYTAIIYHLATFIKAKREAGATNIQEPSVLAFSGNGSKLLQILNADTKVGKQMLGAYTKAIFEKVNGRPYAHRVFDLVVDPDKPKEATCKGGLLIEQPPTPFEIQDMTDTLLGTSGNEFTKEREQRGKNKYADLTDKDWKGLESTVEDFTHVFFKLAEEQKIHNNFGTVKVTELKKYEDEFTAAVKTDTYNALDRLNLLDSTDPIENSLFFYPITELLNRLAQKIL